MTKAKRQHRNVARGGGSTTPGSGGGSVSYSNPPAPAATPGSFNPTHFHYATTSNAPGNGNGTVSGTGQNYQPLSSAWRPPNSFPPPQFMPAQHLSPQAMPPPHYAPQPYSAESRYHPSVDRHGPGWPYQRPSLSAMGMHEPNPGFVPLFQAPPQLAQQQASYTPPAPPAVPTNKSTSSTSQQSSAMAQIPAGAPTEQAGAPTEQAGAPSTAAAGAGNSPAQTSGGKRGKRSRAAVSAAVEAPSTSPRAVVATSPSTPVTTPVSTPASTPAAAPASPGSPSSTVVEIGIDLSKPRAPNLPQATAPIPEQKGGPLEVAMVGDTPVVAENKVSKRAAGECILRAILHVLSRDFAYMTKDLVAQVYLLNFGCDHLGGLPDKIVALLSHKMFSPVLDAVMKNGERYISLSRTYFQDAAAAKSLPPLEQLHDSFFDETNKFSLTPIRPLPLELIEHFLQDFDARMIGLQDLFPIVPSRLYAPVYLLQDFQPHLQVWYPSLFPSPDIPSLDESKFFTSLLSKKDLSTTPVNELTPEIFVCLVEQAQHEGMAAKRAKKVISNHSARVLLPIEKERLANRREFMEMYSAAMPYLTPNSRAASTTAATPYMGPNIATQSTATATPYTGPSVTAQSAAAAMPYTGPSITTQSTATADNDQKSIASTNSARTNTTPFIVGAINYAKNAPGDQVPPPLYVFGKGKEKGDDKGKEKQNEKAVDHNMGTTVDDAIDLSDSDIDMQSESRVSIAQGQVAAGENRSGRQSSHTNSDASSDSDMPLRRSRRLDQGVHAEGDNDTASPGTKSRLERLVTIKDVAVPPVLGTVDGVGSSDAVKRGKDTKEAGYLPPSGIFTLPRPILPPLPGRPPPYDEAALMQPIQRDGLSRDEILAGQKTALEKILQYVMTLPMNMEREAGEGRIL